VRARVVTGTRWSFGSSLPPFHKGNVAGHVGDDLGAVAANRSALAAMAQLSLDDVVVMDPVHGGDVFHVADPKDVVATAIGRVAPRADALVTSVPGVGLMTMGADCAPVTLTDPEAGVIAVVHVGWKGLVAQILANTVSAMCELGATPERLVGTVHACICAPHYPVPDERATLVRDVSPSAVIRLSDGRQGIDLRAGISAQAASLSVGVIIDDECTFESQNLFSHRRDGVTGRHGVLVVLQ
jgi:polyphenol oxidase